MRARLRRVSALAAICTGAALMTFVPSAGAQGKKACSEITGAGSSLQKIAQKEVWIEGAEAFGKTGERWKKSECEKEPKITYFPSSSGKGKAQWGSKTKKLEEETIEGTKVFPDYVGTDAGPEGPASKEGTQLNNMDIAGGQGTKEKEGVVTVPVAQSAVSVLISLPESCSAKEGTTAKVKSLKLAEEWAKNKLSLEQLLTGTGLEIKCKETPQLWARASSSGTTAGIKRYLNDIDPAEFPYTTLPEFESAEKWPILPKEENGKKEKLEKGSQLAEAVFTEPGTKGAIGYADLADALKVGYTTKVEKHGHKYQSFMVEVQRNGKNSTTPTYASPRSGEESNCLTAAFAAAPKEVTGNADWSVAKQSNVENTETYPVCTLTFDLAWHKYSKPVKPNGKHYEESEYNSVFNFFKYLVKGTEGGQNAELAKKHYGKLTKPVKEEAEKGVTEANIGF